ncbi:MCE family protein [Rhodococcus gannanensis]|uniref:MCE family protein n=1 Tax=Rhodococcus gannanensis TaxID=1960308 RepID=A0ABW4P033_9NOCA
MRASDSRRVRLVRLLAAAVCAPFVATGCGWEGVNSLPLPGAPGRGPGAVVFHVEMANVGTIESNSPVLMDDVVIGSVGAMEVDGWHARVDVSVEPGIVVPANVEATIGQTSLLGSSHLALNLPVDAVPAGELESGSTIPLSKTSTYPSTEKTLSALSVVVNGGGLGQIGDIIESVNTAFEGRQDDYRELITRLDAFVGTLDRQRDGIVVVMRDLDRLAGTFAQQNTVVTDALEKFPPALEVLSREQPNLTAALDRLRVFSDTATGVVTDVQDDLVTNLRNLEPTLRALADVGPDINKALAYATVYPYGQSVIDRAVKGDYVNLFATVDLTVPRLQREILLGTPWGDPNAAIQAAVGDPGYATQTKDPLGVGVTPQGNGGR